jgi:hypothetical protein
MNRRPLLTSAVSLFIFLFLSELIDGLYTAKGLDFPVIYAWLAPFAFAWLMWSWLREDSRRFGITWPLDLGMFLIAAWPIILPFHLFRTRRLKALIPILLFALTMFLGAIAAAVLSLLF